MKIDIIRQRRKDAYVGEYDAAWFEAERGPGGRGNEALAERQVAAIELPPGWTLEESLTGCLLAFAPGEDVGHDADDCLEMFS